jgi:uncharacterized protein Yka (UPF0111/DUF47 family)
MSGETQRAETPRMPEYTLASPEFFHLLHRVEQVEATLRQEIKQVEIRIDQVESTLRQEIKQVEIRIDQVESTLRQEIKQTEANLRQEMAGVRSLIWATLALITAAFGLTVAVMLR